jgi:hypothetical protein
LSKEESEEKQEDINHSSNITYIDSFQSPSKVKDNDNLLEN